MWHASVAVPGPRGPIPVAALPVMRRVAASFVALQALDGVGDKALGQWLEDGETAVHARRRLSVAEWGDHPWGMDYRGTPEGEQRLVPCRRWLPAGYSEWSDGMSDGR